MNEAFAVICRRHRLIPVAVVDNTDQAPALGQALIAAGLPLVEVTLRTPAGLAAIAALAADGGPVAGPDQLIADQPMNNQAVTDQPLTNRLLVGAGTVVTAEQVDAAVAAGACFIVSPGYNQAIVARTLELGVAALPGVATAGEMMAAIAQGLKLVKFFPAAQLGGPSGLAAFTGVFPELNFVPTGGVNLDNLGEYLAMKSVAAVGGSWMVPRQAIGRGDFDTIKQLAGAAVATVASYSAAKNGR